jgi:uncharacterized repeat protein (TIGR03833 family)
LLGHSTNIQKTHHNITSPKTNLHKHHQKKANNITKSTKPTQKKQNSILLYNIISTRTRKGERRWGGKKGKKKENKIMPVPTITQVIPGASVSIVLKADQPTGRQVQGTVQNVLTSGNHPRGIKVRLGDGRIGRVQRMTTRTMASETLNTSTSVASTQQQRLVREGENRRSKFQSRDVRLEEEEGEAPAEEIDLFAYMKPAKQQKKKKKKQGGAKVQESVVEEESSGMGGVSTATCPVCGEFEGDESAVAHHVESHFA